MKKIILILTAIVFGTYLITSCGSSTKKDSTSKEDSLSTKDNPSEKVYTLKSWKDQVTVDGEAGKFIELIDKTITLKEIPDPLSNQKVGDWGTSLKFKVIAKSNKWLDDMEITFLDDKGEQLYDFESTMTDDAASRNSLLEKINDGSGFYEVKFQNFLSSTILNTKEEAAAKIKKFNENISKAKYFKVMAKMKNNPNG